MLNTIKLDKILFLDIETTSAVKTFDDLSEDFKKHWKHKSNFIGKEDETPQQSYSRAGIYAEFGKIVCISVGFVKIDKGVKHLILKSFYHHEESELLIDFFEMLNNHFNTPQHILCAHNGKEFDYPYIARRGLVNGLNIPEILDLAGKKPWEVQHIDTLQLWKFGDYKHFTSLSLLTTIFDIPTPKDDIDGSMVNKVYWEDNDLERIALYCQKDVVALTQLFLRFRNESLIHEENFIYH